MKLSKSVADRVIRMTLSLFGLLILVSCSTIYFQKPMPIQAEIVHELPESFIGEYSSLEDPDDMIKVIKYSEFEYRILFGKKDSIHNKKDFLTLDFNRKILTQYLDSEIFSTSECLIKNNNKAYYLNYYDKEERQGWEVIILEFLDDILLVTFFSGNPSQYIEAIRYSDDNFLISPSDYEFYNLVNKPIITTTLQYKRSEPFIKFKAPSSKNIQSVTENKKTVDTLPILDSSARIPANYDNMPPVNLQSTSDPISSMLRENIKLICIVLGGLVSIITLIGFMRKKKRSPDI
ncbi:MAG: hypothetical protein RLP14_02010 [Owenweeksia sp.]